MTTTGTGSESTPSRVSVALVSNRIVKGIAIIAALFTIYTEGATGYLKTEEAIQAKAAAANAAVKQGGEARQAEAELAEWKSITETEIARNAERKQRAEAKKATADAKRADAEATIAAQTSGNSEVKAKAEADAMEGEAAIKEQQIIIERERAAQAERLNQAEATNAEYQAAAQKFANLAQSNRINLDTGAIMNNYILGRH